MLHLTWMVLGGVGVALAAWSVVRSLHAGRIGADLLALLAEVGALVAGERVAAGVIALMIASGMVLDSVSSRRAGRDLRALVERQPRRVRRRVGDNAAGTDRLVVIDVDEIGAGDVLVVSSGEVVATDGIVRSPHASLDESALTGEPIPVTIPVGGFIRSGSVNAGAPFEMRATSTPEASTYAGIVRMASTAGTARAPMVCLADRAAVGLLVIGVMAAGAAWWWTGTLGRAVAVLVVATPCPLILAVPIALSGGLSRAARRGIVIKGGPVLERLAGATVLLIDKTGTLTVGTPSVTAVMPADGGSAADALGAAAAVEQVSSHVMARAIVEAAAAAHLSSPVAQAVTEELGLGVRGTVAGRRVRVGSSTWLGHDADRLVARATHLAAATGGAVVGIEIDGRLAAVLLIGDEPRPEAARTIRRLRALGVGRIIMVTGDRTTTARWVARRVGIDEVRAAQDPGGKAAVAGGLRAPGATVVMVGDGINDAPVLAAADVGVVMGGRGDSGAPDVADVVIGVDRIDRVADAIAIAQRSSRLARQSALGGVALSIVAMAVALSGHLPPAWGALGQELIDVAAILNALRVLRDHTDGARLEGSGAAVARRFSAEHAALRPSLDHLAALADALGAGADPTDLAPAREALELLRRDWLPHEAAEETVLYPVVADAIGPESTSVMSREHIEIIELVDQLEQLIADAGHAPSGDDVSRIRGVLYGLHAVLRMHTDQEDEGYLSLAEPSDVTSE